MPCEYDRPCGASDCDRCHPENYVAVECVECGTEGPRWAMHQCDECGGWLCDAEGETCEECGEEAVQSDVGRFRRLPLANEEPADPLASYYCDECGDADWTDTLDGGGIREFYADDEIGDTICEPCMRKRAANAELRRGSEPSPPTTCSAVRVLIDPETGITRDCDTGDWAKEPEGRKL
jgi:hypothetical protein